jgi:hypothetical protein
MPIVMAKEILMNEEGIQKATSALMSAAGAAAASASTPEEAYKRFMTLAGKVMMQVMAEALAGAVSESVTKTADNPKIAGWERFVSGCTVSLDFGAPIDFENSASVASISDYQKLLTNKLQTSAQAKGSGVGLVGGSISVSVGGSWSF